MIIKRSRLWFSVLAVLFFTPVCGWSQPVTVSISAATGSATVATIVTPGVICVSIDWLSDATDDCVATISGVHGWLHAVTYNPDGGSTAPTASYDITCTDEDGLDVLISTGANLSATVTTTPAIYIAKSTLGAIGYPIYGDLTFTVANAGVANGGIVRLWLGVNP